MVVRLYSVYDRVAQEFGPIAEFSNDAVAFRAFTDALKENSHREDFKPMYLGTFDKSKGFLEPWTPCELEPGQLELELSPKVVRPE